MPRFPKAQKRPDNTPAFLITAKRMYGEAFGPRRQADLAESMADWADLTDEEQSFTQAHLQYLNLVAQAGTQRLLVQVCELLTEIEEGVTEALDEAVEALIPVEPVGHDEDSAGSVLETPLIVDEVPEDVEIIEPDDGGEE